MSEISNKDKDPFQLAAEDELIETFDPKTEVKKGGKPGAAQFFKLAFVGYMKAKPRGYQTELAKQLNLSRQYVNDIINRKDSVPDHIKDAIAEALGTTVIDMLIIGQDMAKTGIFFPYAKHLHSLPEHSMRRAHWIFIRAAKDFNLVMGQTKEDIVLDIEQTRSLVSMYLSKKTSDAALYEYFCAYFKEMLKSYI